MSESAQDEAVPTDPTNTDTDVGVCSYCDGPAAGGNYIDLCASCENFLFNE